MRVKLFTFRYSTTLGGFDDEALQIFVRDKEVLAFREHFFTVNDMPHFACVMTWQERTVSAADVDLARTVPRPSANPRAAGRRGPKEDPTASLSEPDRILFNTLREWRAARARDEAVPPYVIFTNRELVEIVVKKPADPTALSNVSGVGAKKVERHGASLLKALGGRGGALTPFLAHRPAAREAGPELLVLARWEELTAWLMTHTGRWPKTARFTLVQRIQNHALDVAEQLVVARYEPRKRGDALHDVNLRLERMRLLLRIARETGVQSKSGFESAARGVDEVGRMVHGWRESLR